MQFVRLGRTEALVSVIGLGCGGASLLGMAQGRDVNHAVDIVRYAMDLGITFIDTARNYPTEDAVGKAISGRRDTVFLSTKSPAGVRDHLLSAIELSRNLDESLRRLSTDHIDVFHLHSVKLAQYSHCFDVLLPELKRQQNAGKIRFLGITEDFGRDTRHAMLARALPDNAFDVIMAGFNLLNPSARKTVLPLTQKHDVGTLIMFAVRRALSHPETLRRVVRDLLDQDKLGPAKVDIEDPLGFLREHAEVNSIIEAAYRFCRHEPGAHIVLTGTGDALHLKQNVASILAPPLPAEILERLRVMFCDIDSVSGG